MIKILKNGEVKMTPLKGIRKKLLKGEGFNLPLSYNNLGRGVVAMDSLSYSRRSEYAFLREVGGPKGRLP